MSQMTGDDLIEWCGKHEATLTWRRDEYGRQVVELTLPRDPEPVMLTVAANARVRPGEVLAAAVERWASELSAQHRRARLKAV